MKRFDYIISGCGLSGLMLAYRMAKDAFFDNKSILLLDTEKKKGNDRTWSYWEEGPGEWDEVVVREWNQIRVCDQKTDLEVDIAPYLYKTILSSKFYDFLWQEIEQRKNISVRFEKILNISHRTRFASVLTETGEYSGKKVFNSVFFNKKYNQQSKFPVLNQHFVGWFIETKEDAFDDQKVTFMDFSVEQQKNTRFMYILPFTKRYALFEYTLFSPKLLRRDEYDEELKLYLDKVGIQEYTIKETEVGSIPMTSYKFWRSNSRHVLYIGTAGGWTKASTGYTFKNSDKKTKELVDFLKEETVLKKFREKTRFWFYDLLFLDVLSKHNDIGSVLFTKLFKKNSPKVILKFLDEETSLKEEIKIMASMPPIKFIKALIRRIRIY